MIKGLNINSSFPEITRKYKMLFNLWQLLAISQWKLFLHQLNLLYANYCLTCVSYSGETSQTKLNLKMKFNGELLSSERATSEQQKHPLWVSAWQKLLVFMMRCSFHLVVSVDVCVCSDISPAECPHFLIWTRRSLRQTMVVWSISSLKHAAWPVSRVCICGFRRRAKHVSPAAADPLQVITAVCLPNAAEWKGRSVIKSHSLTQSSVPCQWQDDWMQATDVQTFVILSAFGRHAALSLSVISLTLVWFPKGKCDLVRCCSFIAL